jgi:PAS domain S-box-containing protein
MSVLASRKEAGNLRAMIGSLDPAKALETIVEGLGQPFYAVDGAWRIVLYNDEAARHFDRPAEEMLGRRLWDAFPQDVDAERGRILVDAMARRRPVRGEVQSMIESRWVSYHVFPLGDGLGVIFHDVTDRRRAERQRAAAEEALRRRTAELEAVLQTVPTAVLFTRDRKARDIVANRRAVDLLRLPGEADEGRHRWPDHRFLRDGQAIAAEALPLQRALRGEAEASEVVELAFEDGERRTLLMRAAALRATDDGPDGAVCAIADVTERHRYEDHLKLMLHELDHRVKNTLAVVQSIASLTMKDIDPTARQAFEQRLMTLSAVHGLLRDNAWHGMQMRDVVREALRVRPGDEQVLVDGEDVRVLPKSAVILSMSLHELAANAHKHGALSSPGGRVSVCWRLDADRFRLTWTESGGPPVAPPSRSGFGRRLLERGLAAELEGDVRLDFRPQGVECTVDAPADAIRGTRS